MSTLANINVNDNPASHAAEGHDANGRFKAGNKGGPGNPFAGRVAWFRQMMLECVTKEDIVAVVKSLVELAKDGHWQAAKLVLAYTIGKPQPFADLGTAFDCDTLLSPEPGREGLLQPLPDDAPPPSANGEIQEPPPSTNGVSAPPRNRKERRALRKAHRLAKQQRNTPKPVPVL